jgi:hypothetical protein
MSLPATRLALPNVDTARDQGPRPAACADSQVRGLLRCGEPQYGKVRTHDVRSLQCRDLPGLPQATAAASASRPPRSLLYTRSTSGTDCGRRNATLVRQKGERRDGIVRSSGGIRTGPACGSPDGRGRGRSVLGRTRTPGRFSPFWLRDHCHARESLHPDTLQRQVDTFAIPLDIAPERIDVDARGEILRIVWKHDGSTSVWPAEFLWSVAQGGSIGRRVDACGIGSRLRAACPP